jgi:NAD(P)-dependent dehydrogenase (short-subunit alcohol dehydrogenase family)
MASPDTVANPTEARLGRLEGKVAVISGASSGIGAATMRLFGREGAKVVATARRQDKLEEGLQSVRDAGSDGIVVPADLEDPDTAERVVQITDLIAAVGIPIQYSLRYVSTSDAMRSPGGREHLYDQLAPATRAEARRVRRPLPRLARGVVADVGGPSATRAVLHNVFESSLTGIFSSASRSRSSCGERPSVVR